jgi:hypothetical protein
MSIFAKAQRGTRAPRRTTGRTLGRSPDPRYRNSVTRNSSPMRCRSRALRIGGRVDSIRTEHEHFLDHLRRSWHSQLRWRCCGRRCSPAARSGCRRSPPLSRESRTTRPPGDLAPLSPCRHGRARPGHPRRAAAKTSPALARSAAKTYKRGVFRRGLLTRARCGERRRWPGQARTSPAMTL